MTSRTFTYLALGDSYTLGEAVPINENFPYQVVQRLRKDGLNFPDPRIIAKTGWTTGELQQAINETFLIPTYDIVTLLIGVNNQYKEMDINIYIKEFEALLVKAISFAGNENDRVIVLSIPDWGITPFAKGRDRNKISAEIDAYNKVNQLIAKTRQVHYINITELTREAIDNESLLTSDSLHPSGKEYGRWAEKLVVEIKEIIVRQSL